jgi:hypothetical protein
MFPASFRQGITTETRCAEVASATVMGGFTLTFFGTKLSFLKSTP